ncbi:hypothetical protein BaRGS_00015853, partial [Batillaria attramentaria]
DASDRQRRGRVVVGVERGEQSLIIAALKQRDSTQDSGPSYPAMRQLHEPFA